MSTKHDSISQLPANRLSGEYSVWPADLVRLADEIARIDPYTDILHFDVADGHFAPALLFFPDLVAENRCRKRAISTFDEFKLPCSEIEYGSERLVVSQFRSPMR